MKHPVTMAFKVFVARTAIFTILMTWYAYTADQLLTIYKLADPNCLNGVGKILNYIEVSRNQCAIIIIYLEMYVNLSFFKILAVI